MTERERFEQEKARAEAYAAEESAMQQATLSYLQQRVVALRMEIVERDAKIAELESPTEGVNVEPVVNAAE